MDVGQRVKIHGIRMDDCIPASQVFEAEIIGLWWRERLCLWKDQIMETGSKAAWKKVFRQAEIRQINFNNS